MTDRDEAGATTATDVERRKRKPKRERAGDTSGAADDASGAGRAKRRDRSLRPDGRERPPFLLEFPDHPQLNRLVEAYESGNYAYVRAQAEPVAEATDDEGVRSAALELRRRIEPDPLIRYLLLASAALLLLLSIYAYTQHGGH